MWLPGVKYHFVTAIEAAIDVGQHICAAEGWGPPQTNGEAIELLGSHGVVSHELADRIWRAAGSANVLVHDYVDVDDSIVLGQLHRLADLRDFAGTVAEWLNQPG